MPRAFRPAALAVLLLFCFAFPAAVSAQNGAALVAALGVGGFADKERAIEAIAATGDPAFVPVLDAMAAGDLAIRKTDGTVVVLMRRAGGLEAVDPASGDSLGDVTAGAVEKIRINNRLRRALRTGIGRLTLMSDDPAIRARAADSVFISRDGDAVPLLDEAIAVEAQPAIRRAMEEARAAAVLGDGASEAGMLAAIEILRARGDRDARAILAAVPQEAGSAAWNAAQSAVAAIDHDLMLWGVAQNVWYGISLGSVLLLAAIGLAITFGVMGVINMAHGEMVMIGAYTAYATQTAVAAAAPALAGYAIVFAIPAAFLVAGLVGVCVERGIIRFLYGRPLETLLATWGLSLVLQQAVRTIFGASNREVSIPPWMSGSFTLGGVEMTYNRLWILLFSVLVLAALALIMRWSRFGLQMRAVTQNRRMASAMGIRTDRVDALTFALGSGIAGMAGVALSQIDNVSPNLGQGYIIDSFMVVVFGGVGNLWGTVIGAMTLGIVNKFLEPVAGAVLGKILVLFLIILFIQRRPRGLFALKGRAVEA